MERLCEYQPPSWTKRLTFIPKCRVKLANIPTPIQKWNIPNIPEGYEISIKRDDMTDCVLTGNKCRKLEFLLADAITAGCQNVIVCGSSFSNLCRSVAIASRQLGLNPHLVLGDKSEGNTCKPEGNMLLNCLSGAECHFVTGGKQGIDFNYEMKKLARNIKTQMGGDSYQIPLGGVTKVGLFGYIEAFEEMIAQGLFEKFDDVIIGAGSTGTVVSLGIANYLTGSKLRIHGVVVGKMQFMKYAFSLADDLLSELGLSEITVDDIVDVIEGYEGEGYGVSTREETDYLAAICRETGIVLDPCYTVKVAIGMVKELHTNPSRFKGNRILFMHTGGIFDIFDGRSSRL